jgi:hypothetical protein
MHYYSPQLAAMLSRLRARHTQAFATVLSMSQRMQYELQRWHSQWVDQGNQLRQEQGARQSLQHRLAQLQERVKSLEEERTLYAARSGGDAAVKAEALFVKLQQERTQLSQDLRDERARSTSMRSSNLSLRLSNAGLLEELSRWRSRLAEPPSTFTRVPQTAEVVGSGSPPPPPPELQPLLELFESYPTETQQVALSALLQVNEALTGLPAPEARSHVSSFRGDRDLVSATRDDRLGALEQLAEGLSDEESEFLFRAMERRRGNGRAGGAGAAESEGRVGDAA